MPRVDDLKVMVRNLGGEAGKQLGLLDDAWELLMGVDLRHLAKHASHDGQPQGLPLHLTPICVGNAYPFGA